MRIHLPRRLLWSFTIGLLILLCVEGCGGGSHPAKTRSTARPPVAHKPAAKRKSTKPAAPWTEAFTPRFSWTWRESSPGGFRYLTKLGVGRFTKLSAAPLLPGFKSTAEIASGCGHFNEATDAIAPAAITMTNETRGRSATLETHVFTVDPAGFYARSSEQPTGLSVAAGYTSGVDCYEVTSPVSVLIGQGRSWSVRWDNRARPRRSPGVSYAYLIIHNYFSSKYPSGDPATLRNALLDVGGSSTYRQPRQLDSLAGPGVFRSPKGLLVAIIPLNGKRSCRYKPTDFDPVLTCGIR